MAVERPCDGMRTLDGKRIPGRKTIEEWFGLRCEVTTDLGRLSMPSSIGQFGWYGAAAPYCQIDSQERIVAIALAQHFPFNQHDFFTAFQTGYCQAPK